MSTNNEGARPQYNDGPSAPPTSEQQQRRERALIRQARLKEQALRDFDIGSAIMSGTYEVPE